MKPRHWIAALGTGLAVAAGPSLAQTSVAIYGIVDAGIQASSFGNGTSYALQSGIADGSRLGFRGTEDLGGGWKTIFTLEARIELDNGTNSNGYISGGFNQNLVRGL
ncbi:MAG: porin, partial [Burkholderiaceae bacterium]